MASNSDISLILGRPFLATAEACIDVKQGTISFIVGKDKVTFRKKRVVKPHGGKCNMVSSSSHSCDMLGSMLDANPIFASVILWPKVGEGDM